MERSGERAGGGGGVAGVDGVLGIHHVTAIASDPQRNVDFYAGVLGLRLVKVTVNYDDPGSYHLYYADGAGSPGTVLTFFPWPTAPRGRVGAGMASALAYAAPSGSLGFWAERLRGLGIESSVGTGRFGRDVLAAQDPDGMTVEIVADDAASVRVPWASAGVPGEHALRGFHSVTLREATLDATSNTLTETLGFRAAGTEGTRHRFEAGGGGASAIVDVVLTGDPAPGRGAAGTFHHVAWRARDDGHHEALRGRIAAAGHRVTPVIDRTYFHAIYFREPGGVLFEVSTDGPGFATDEPAATMGTRLVLPPHLEPRRAALEETLPRLVLPGGVRP